MLRVFLSHSAKDQELARSIKEYCARLNIALYMYQDDPQPGRQVSEKLMAAITNSNVFFALLTPSAIASPSVNTEIGIAIRNGTHVVPLVQKGVDITGMVFLQGREWVEFDPYDQHVGYKQMTTYFDRVARQYEVAREVAATQAKTQQDNITSAIIGVGLIILAGVLLTNSDPE